jgi:hypothetical protein
MSKMTRRFRAKISCALWSALLVVVGSLWVAPAAEAGVGISPVRLQFDEGLRGGTFVQSLQLSNEPSTDSGVFGDAKLLQFKLQAQGEIAEWISFSGPESETPQTLFDLARGERLGVRVSVKVPSAAVNRKYQGSVFIEAADIGTAERGQASAGVGTAAEIAVIVNVGGTERREAAVTDFVIDTAEVGLKQRFTAKIRNSGNVLVASQLEVKISRQNSKIVALTSEGNNFPVLPANDGTVFVDWDTSEQLGGAYEAEFTVTDRSGVTPVTLGTKKLSFRLDPRGTFTRAGKFVSLALTSLPDTPGPVVAQAEFLNSGKIAVSAIFDGEISLNGKLMKSIQSLPRVIRPGETGRIGIRFDAVEGGDYRAAGKINFDGELTEEKSLVFTLNFGPALRANGNGRDGGTNLLLVGGIVVGVTIGVIGVVLLVRKKRLSSPPNLPVVLGQ